MLHPVGKLPAAVYWRRRALVLLVLVALVGGGGWLVTIGIAHWRPGTATATAATTTPPAPRPALEQVVPAGLEAPVAAAPCADRMLGVSVRGPARAAVGAKTTVALVVTNTSDAPCVSALDKTLQEIVLLDAHGTRVWGSADCSHESGTDTRTLAAGQAVSFPLVWDGRSSEPTCSAPRTPVPAGQYVLRGRLGTKVGLDAPLVLS